MTVLKEHNIVHGDLLPHDFMITTDDKDDYCVRVVDFDWAGDKGSVKYPVNMELQWPTGVGAGCEITHQHDEHLLDTLIKSLK